MEAKIPLSHFISGENKLSLNLNQHSHQAIRNEEYVVEMRGIVKRFLDVIANDHVDFKLKKGEIHALLGENGAGKTTLMNILYGIYMPDEGEIYVDGKLVEIRSPRDAIKLGIGMVHQHFMLVETLSVAENLAMGLKTSFLNPAEEVKLKVKDVMEKYGLKVNLDAKVWQLSTGEKQRIEILKAICRGAKILILDEPTSVLTPGEVRELFKFLRRMASEGKSIIFVTHKLKEVMEISDRVTVLRKGKVVGVMETSKTNEYELAKLMVGREVVFELEKAPSKLTDPQLKVEKLNVLGDRGQLAVKDVSFEVRGGEIYGIAGVAGNGQRELVEAIAGLRKVVSGKIYIGGVDVTNSGPSSVIKLGVAFIPEDRKMGFVPNMSVAENLVLKKYRENPFSNRFILNYDAIEGYAKKLIEEYKIATPSEKALAKLLSGGNIQRLILARELSSGSEVIIAVHPTYGLDVGSTEYVRRLLLKRRSEGVAILLISEDLDEILSLSDRIAVMFEGRIVGELPCEKADIETLGLMMSGAYERR